MKRIWNWYYVAALMLPLLLIALIPALRVPAFKLVTGGNAGIYNLPLGNQSHYVFQPSEILAGQPNSVAAQAWGVNNGVFPDALQKFESASANSRGVSKMRAFAALWKAHPEKISLLVQALANVPDRNGRVAGPWEDVTGWIMSSYPSLAAGPPLVFGPAGAPGFTFPSSPLPPNEMTESDAEFGLQLARQGQALEPNNTFYDWMAAHFLFTLHRDDEAAPLLVKASAKTGFDMHWRELLGGYYETFQRASPLLPEEKWSVLQSVTSRHILIIRHTVRLMEWCAMQRETSGDAAAALTLERALLRLQMTGLRRGILQYERDSFAYGVLSTLGAPEFMKWARVLGVGKPKIPYSLSTPMIQSFEQRLDKKLGLFTTYARAHSRPDIAREAAADSFEVSRYARDENAGIARESFLELRSGGALAQINLWWWFAVLSLIQGAASVALWLGFTILGPYLPPRGESVPHLGMRALVYPLAIGGAFTLCLCGLSAALFFQQWHDPDLSATFRGGDASFYGIAAALCPAAAATLYCLAGTVRRTWKKPASAPDKKPRFAPRDLGASAEMDEFLRLFWQFQNLLWFRVLPWVTFPLLAIYVLATFPIQMPWGQGGSWIPAYEPLYLNDLVGEVLLLAALVYFAALSVRWTVQGRSPARKAAVFAGSFALRRALAWCLPLALWFLLVALVGGDVARGQFDNQLTRFLSAENQG